MNFTGIVIGIVSFLSIGVFHPIVIKAEYHFGKGCWPVFAVAAAIFLAVSAFVNSVFLSTCLAVIGMSCGWTILELFEQEKRVERGWFPANPKRKIKSNNEQVSENGK